MAANQRWLDEVRQRLAHQALPPAYIRRFVEELSDHLEDLMEENMSTEANLSSRLGKPQQVAEAAVTAYRRRSFLGRHPVAAFLVFAVSPVLALSALVIASMLAILVPADRIFSSSAESFPREFYLALPSALTALTIIIPSILAAVVYCYLASRCCMSGKWAMVSCGVLAALAATLHFHVKVSPVPGQSCLLFGSCVPVHAEGVGSFLKLIFFGSRQTLQLAIPLAVGLWFVWRSRAERQEGQLRPAG